MIPEGARTSALMIREGYERPVASLNIQIPPPPPACPAITNTLLLRHVFETARQDYFQHPPPDSGRSLARWRAPA